MNTFGYRDLRRQRITDALVAVDANAPDRRAQLEAERAALQSDDWSVSDRSYLAVAADWLWGIRLTLKLAVDSDPVFAALGTTSALTLQQAADIETIPHGPGGPPANYLALVRSAVGGDEAVVTELIHAAHADWLRQPDGMRNYPFDDVGVLLPLRLETLFDGPGTEFNDSATQWKISVRVVPDEASICRDDRFVSPGEQTALQAFWLASQVPGDFGPDWLDSDAAAVAWDILSRQVTPSRAAWLVANLPPVLDGDQLTFPLPAEMPAASEPNRVGGLPPELQVWAVNRDAGGGLSRTAVGRLPMDADSVIRADALPLAIPDRPESTRDAWWSSWETAKTVGLGGEWLLADGMTPATLDSLYVLGIGDESPDDHFRAQSDSGELEVIRLGAPTNSVHGGPTAGAADPAGWRSVAKARLQQQVAGAARPTAHSGRSIEQSLTGDADRLPFFPGADAPDDTQDSRRYAQALWPALHGHWLADLWELGEDAFWLNRWAFPRPDQGIPGGDEIREAMRRPCEDLPTEPPAARYCPEGPLMPLRIGDQPYGLLPVTALSQWQPAAAFTAEDREIRRVERQLAAVLTGLRASWAGAARAGGTVVGASSEKFLEFLGRDAVSRRYIERTYLPVASWAAPFQLDAGTRERFEEIARRMYEDVANLTGRLPETLYLTDGYWRANRLPLVQPTLTTYRHVEGTDRGRVALSSFLSLLFDEQQDLDLAEVFRRSWVLDQRDCFLRVLPDSLLIRLLVHACQLNIGWQLTQTGGDVALPALLGQAEAVRSICCELDQRDWQREGRDPATGEPIFTVLIPDERRSQLERALRATIDGAAHRIDPWITGIAWDRLQQHSSSPRHSHRLGAYGWVDGPFLGEPGPTDAGRLHTPSYGQTLAAIILRDKFLSSRRSGSANDRGGNPWEMNISSAKARLAEELADEVRLGFHIYEVVGRQVENVLADHQQVKKLRTSPAYAMRSERLDPNEVCNGREALRGMLAGDADFPLDAGQLAALELLRDSLDTYSDLLMADGVMQLINRQTDRAAESMDAAAGFSRPPSFEFLRTPPSGYQLDTVILAALPYISVAEVTADPAAHVTPIRLADPSLAGFVEARFGAAWTWTAVNTDDDAVLGTVGLGSLGLTPIDTLALSAEFLGELVRRSLALPVVSISEARQREWQVIDPVGNALGVVTLTDLRLLPAELAALEQAALDDLVRAQLGAPPDSVVTELLPADPRLWIAVDERDALLGMATVGTLGLTAAAATALDQPALFRRVRQALTLPQVLIQQPAQHLSAQHLTGALGSRPAAGRDLAVDSATQRAVDTAVYAELADRYLALYTACQRLIDELRTAADDATRAALLRSAVGWGVTPTSEAADREALFAALLGSPAPPGARPLAELADGTAAVLAARLAAAPAPADLVPAAAIGTPVADHEDRKQNQQPDGVPTLAQAMANLAAPEVRLTILACWTPGAVLDNTALVTAEPEPDLDETWLTVAAAVRPALARLEALQLELDPPLTAWSSAPGDPWRSGADQVVQRNLAERSAGSTLSMDVNQRFVAAYGGETAWDRPKVAVGLIDSFGEAVPMPQRSTMAAFGFNAPAAKAPQAILLAVPPRVRQRLDIPVLQQIVEETRELAHARTAHVEDLGALQALTPYSWLQSSGPRRVRLEPYPLFTS